MEFTNSHRLQLLEGEARACKECELSIARNQVVFASGPFDSQLVVVGEAPGAAEDRDGLPFIGRSGQLLTRLIEEELGLQRSDYYITNVVKCRPQGNRKPLSVEIDACSRYLRGQLENLTGGVVLAVGEVAARALTNHKGSLASVRGTVLFVGGKRVVVTYHPAYALRGGRRVEQAMRSDLSVVGGLLSGK